MKNVVFLVIVSSSALLFSCSHSTQEYAKNQNDKILTKPGETNDGYVLTCQNGYFMKATINGKDWNASNITSYHMTTYENRITGENGEDYISFPFNETWDRPGNPRKLTNEGDAAELSYSIFGNNHWAGIDGEIVILEENETFIYGKFYFTAVSTRSNKKFKITNGIFRILRPKD
jgi:hypothetical protein